MLLPAGGQGPFGHHRTLVAPSPTGAAGAARAPRHVYVNDRLRKLGAAGALMGVTGAALVLAARLKSSRENRSVASTVNPSAVRSGSSATAAVSVSPSASALTAAPQEPRVLLRDEDEPDLAAQRRRLLRRIDFHYRDVAGYDPVRVRAVFDQSSILGQGNPKVTRHPLSRSDCRQRRQTAETTGGSPQCGAPHMRLVSSAGSAAAATDKVCIDQFEFPNIPCEYPVVLARASEAHALCKAVGKRLCDAHEWEGACAGSLRSVEEEYAFGERRMMMTYLHNKKREVVWAYGSERHHELCGTSSRKSRGCLSSEYDRCGSNTFPAGSFPQCRSPAGVYDQHGNAAEHMNMPLSSAQLTGRGGSGETEMKGSWFIFAGHHVHDDDCRWRAPAWHSTLVTAPDSHRNFHLGFRCCANVPPEGVAP